jgi:hypothetical protein
VPTTRTIAIPLIVDEAALVGGLLMAIGITVAFMLITGKWGKP